MGKRSTRPISEALAQIRAATLSPLCRDYTTTRVTGRTNAWRDRYYIDRKILSMKILQGAEEVGDLSPELQSRLPGLAQQLREFADTWHEDKALVRKLVLHGYTTKVTLAETVEYLDGNMPKPSDYDQWIEDVTKNYNNEIALIDKSPHSVVAPQPRTAVLHIGPSATATLNYGVDALHGIPDIPEGAMLTVTSPPLLGTRSTGIKDEIGMEDCFYSYLLNLTDRLVACEARMSRFHGGLCVSSQPLSNGSAQTGGTNSISGKGRSQPHTNYKRMVEGWPPQCLLDLPGKLISAMEKRGVFLAAVWYWVKPNACPLSVARNASSVETILVFHRDPVYRHRNHVSEPAVEKGKFRKRRNTITNSTGGYIGDHVAVMPTRVVAEIMDRALTVGTCVTCGKPWTAKEHILRWDQSSWIPSCDCPGNTKTTRKPALVVDPFAGSGTTGIVACQRDSHFYGIDLNAQYLPGAERRLYGLHKNVPLVEDDFNGVLDIIEE